jgi:thymidine phosphorylase
METPAQALELARALVGVGRGAGLQVEAWVTAMDRPLGRAVGNALEVAEAWACLRGEGPADLRALVLELAADPRAAQALDSGAAAEVFARMVRAQGGDPEAPLLGAGVAEASWRAPRDGWVASLKAGGIGRAAFGLGAGRSSAEEAVDPGVGLVLQVALGEQVQRGQELVRIYHRDGQGLERALEPLSQACVIGDAPPTPLPLVVARC